MDVKPKEGYQEKFITGNEKSDNKIVLLPIQGLIMDPGERDNPYVFSPRRMQELLHIISRDDAIKAVILEMNSPGGGVTASDIIYRYLKEFKKAHPTIPVLCLMQDTATSGAYYIAMASDYIIAHPTSITGSIGVISIFFSGEDLIKWAKVDVVVLKSGKSKDSGSFFRRMEPEEQEVFQEIIDQMYKGFVDIVAEGRQSHLTRQQILALADGRIFLGKEAYENKLVDALGYLEDAVNKAKELAQVEDAKVIKYHKIPGLMESMFSFETPRNSLDRFQDLLLQQSPGSFMYLWLSGVRY
jgi:protease-4